MEQFTRECLEIDTDAGADGDARPAKAFSMDKVYERAAKLVKKTLDVEGAIVMDVSHADVLETISAEGTMSVVVHSADAPEGTRTHMLSAEEYARLYETFVRYPDGKVSEGLVPAPLRPFIPTGIQYALSESPPWVRRGEDQTPDATRFVRRADLQYRQAAVRHAVRVQLVRAGQTLRTLRHLSAAVCASDAEDTCV